MHDTANTGSALTNSKAHPTGRTPHHAGLARGSTAMQCAVHAWYRHANPEAQ